VSLGDPAKDGVSTVTPIDYLIDNTSARPGRQLHHVHRPPTQRLGWHSWLMDDIVSPKLPARRNAACVS
jgi:hypothetical protein